MSEISTGTIAKANGEGDSAMQLDLIQNVAVSISVEVGRSSLRIRDLLRLGQGSVVELDRVAGEPLDVCVNNTVIARGEVVLVNERYGIRLTQVVDPEDRVKHLCCPMDPVRYISAIILVGALLALAIWLLRRFNLTGMATKAPLTVVGHLSVGTREKLLVVRFGSEDVLLGITPHSITRLGSVPAGTGQLSAESDK